VIYSVLIATVDISIYKRFRDNLNYCITELMTLWNDRLWSCFIPIRDNCFLWVSRKCGSTNTDLIVHSLWSYLAND